MRLPTSYCFPRITAPSPPQFHCCLLVFLSVSTGCTDTDYYCTTVQMREKSLTFMQENESLRWYSCFAAVAILELSDAIWIGVRETGHKWVKHSSSSSECCTSQQAQIRMCWTDPLPVYTRLCGDNTLKAIPWAGWNGLSHILIHRRKESSNITSSQQYRFPQVPFSLVTEPTCSPELDQTNR